MALSPVIMRTDPPEPDVWRPGPPHIRSPEETTLHARKQFTIALKKHGCFGQGPTAFIPKEDCIDDKYDHEVIEIVKKKRSSLKYLSQTEEWYIAYRAITRNWFKEYFPKYTGTYKEAYLYHEEIIQPLFAAIEPKRPPGDDRQTIPPSYIRDFDLRFKSALDSAAKLLPEDKVIKVAR